MAPKINRNDLPATTIKVDQPFGFNVNVSGEPPPEITWMFGDKILSPKDRLSIDNPEYKSNFAMERAKRQDSGTYKIIAKNGSGQDTAEVQVLVLGKQNFSTEAGKITMTINIVFSKTDGSKRSARSKRRLPRQYDFGMGSTR